MSMLEVIVTQAIVIILATGLISLVVAMVKKLHSETAVSDSQVHLRQGSHLLLRDLQGSSKSYSRMGGLIDIVDGGGAGSDSILVFKKDESLCNGQLTVTGNDPNDVGVLIDDTNGCPLSNDPASGCFEGELANRTVLLIGNDSAALIPTQVGGGSCRFIFPNGASDFGVDAWNATHPANPAGDVQDILDAVQPTQILIGSSYGYRLNGNTLERSIDALAAWEPVIDRVFDLQFERIYDVNRNGLIDSGEIISASASVPLPAGFSGDNFLGVRIGIVTFSRANDSLNVRPPPTFSNRNLSAAPTGRRYRSSFVLAAVRNED